MPQFVANLGLSALNGSNGFRIDGETEFDIFGSSVSSAGDVNGDGFDDVIVGAPWAEPNGFLSGSAYVVFGKEGGFAPILQLSTLDGSNGFQFSGEEKFDSCGTSVSSAGDINGDGFADFLVGAYGAGPGDGSSGASYVVFGKAGGFAPNIDAGSLNGSNGFRISGYSTGDFSGRSVSSAGDVNGDGFADVIVGAYGANPNGENSGASFIVFGKSAGFAANLDLSTLDGSNGFRISGEMEFDLSGRSVSSGGDVNGDGFDDVIVGAWGAGPHGLSSGASYVVFGKANGFSANLDLSSLDGRNGFQINGEGELDSSGQSVSLAGDVNGDGFGDVIIGAPVAGPDDNGASYVVFGKAGGFAASIDLSTLDGSTGFKISGGAAYDFNGSAVSSAGDVNGDGFDDVIIGAHGASPNGHMSGASYVVFGKAGGFAADIDLSLLSGNDGFRISGAAADDRSGRSVFSAGDVNGDGFDDLIVGAEAADPGGTDSGASYVIFGHRALSAVMIVGTNIAQTSNGGYRNDAISGFGGNDKLNGWEGADMLSGGDGNDILIGGTGADIISGGTGNDALLGGIDADLLRGDAGNDTIVGGPRNDILIGGSGNDTFRYVALTDSGDRINDFTGGGVAGGDRIDFSAIDAMPGGIDNVFLFGGTTATAHGVWYSSTVLKSTVFLDTDGNAATAELTMVLSGVASLIQGDFIL